MLTNKLMTALRALFRKSQAEQELADELQHHIDRQTEQNLRLGMNPEEARLAARSAFGGVEQAKDRSRDARGLKWLDDLVQDLRYGARTLMKNPGFALVATLTLALGIGANTAIFSVINGVLLRPLAFDDPDRLFMLWTDNPAWRLGFHEFPPPPPICPNGARARPPLSKSLRSNPIPLIYPMTERPERIGGVQVSANLLPLLGVQPLLGRHFSAEEERPGQDRVAIISYALWQRRFGGDAEILGRTITVNRSHANHRRHARRLSFPRAAEMPPVYNLPEKADLWTPFARDAKLAESRAKS